MEQTISDDSNKQPNKPVYNNRDSLKCKQSGKTVVSCCVFC